MKSDLVAWEDYCLLVKIKQTHRGYQLFTSYLASNGLIKIISSSVFSPHIVYWRMVLYVMCLFKPQRQVEVRALLRSCPNVDSDDKTLPMQSNYHFNNIAYCLI